MQIALVPKPRERRKSPLPLLLITRFSSRGGFNTKNTLLRRQGAEHCHVAKKLESRMGGNSSGHVRARAGPQWPAALWLSRLHPDRRVPPSHREWGLSTPKAGGSRERSERQAGLPGSAMPGPCVLGGPALLELAEQFWPQQPEIRGQPRPGSRWGGESVCVWGGC